MQSNIITISLYPAYGTLTDGTGKYGLYSHDTGGINGTSWYAATYTRDAIWIWNGNHGMIEPIMYSTIVGTIAINGLLSINGNHSIDFIFWYVATLMQFGS